MAAQGKHRDAIVRTAAKLFRRQGYAATGTNDIVAESGAPKGSLYHYFPDGKAAIAEAALAYAGARVQATLDRLAAEHDSAGALLRAYAKLVAGWMEQSGFRDGCPITSTLLELAPGSPGVAQTGRGIFAGWSSVIAAKLIGAGVPPDHAHRLARTAIATLTGSLVLARAERGGIAIVDAAAELALAFAAAERR